MPPAKVDNDISGKLALVTGASGGIGTACARRLWAENVSLALTYNRGQSRLFELTQELLALQDEEEAASPSGRKISVHQHNAESQGESESLFKDVEQRHGRTPDILISNAGYGKRIPNILDIDVDEFDFTITVNLRAAFILSKLAMPGMLERHWGRVVYVSSIAAQGGGVNGCHYAASKAGLQGMMKNLATIHAKDGITFNDVAPAMIGDTGMIPDARAVAGTPGDVKKIPVGRLGVPDEVANVVLMFCQTGYMTGQSVLVSGGLK